MKPLAIIPARGGSKRIPKKNIRSFCGRPIIEWSIKAALDCQLFDEVMVSTDDDEIADVALHAGASIPFRRSTDTSNDFATTADVLIEVLAKYQELGKEFDVACCIYPTAPFVTTALLTATYEGFVAGNHDAFLILVPFPSPIERAFEINGGIVTMKHPEYERARSQDFTPAYHDAGQLYWFKTREFIERRTVLMPNTGATVVSDNAVQDINTEEDWMLAEMKFEAMVSIGSKEV